MIKTNKKIIGLIGGMGPFASARFLKILLEKSASEFGAKNGDEFPEIILDSVPVPDFISNTETIPVATEMLKDRVRKLDKFGCTSIAMVCNTGHLLFPILSRASGNKMTSLIEAIRDKVVRLKLKKVGLLATKTTINSGLYEKAFENTGIRLVNPDAKLLDLCEVVIRGEIANNNPEKRIKQLFTLTDNFIKAEKLDSVILGCTELPLVFSVKKSDKIIDCLDVLSDKLLNN